MNECVSQVFVLLIKCFRVQVGYKCMMSSESNCTLFIQAIFARAERYLAQRWHAFIFFKVYIYTYIHMLVNSLGSDN